MSQRSPAQTLRIFMFGPFEVFYDGNKLQGKLWQSRQVRSVFKVLVARRGKVTTGEQLLDMLWPGDDPDTALRRLYVRISQLRKLLQCDDGCNLIERVSGGYLFSSAYTHFIPDGNENGERFFWVDVICGGGLRTRRGLVQIANLAPVRVCRAG